MIPNDLHLGALGLGLVMGCSGIGAVVGSLRLLWPASGSCYSAWPWASKRHLEMGYKQAVTPSRLIARMSVTGRSVNRGTKTNNFPRKMHSFPKRQPRAWHDVSFVTCRVFVENPAAASLILEMTPADIPHRQA